jgi:hypothetical protein
MKKLVAILGNTTLTHECHFKFMKELLAVLHTFYYTPECSSTEFYLS